jgi:hypothetical protein
VREPVERPAANLRPGERESITDHMIPDFAVSIPSDPNTNAATAASAPPNTKGEKNIPTVALEDTLRDLAILQLRLVSADGPTSSTITLVA